MSSLGMGRHQVWTKELDDKLLSEITRRRKMIGITVTMKMSEGTIEKRLKEMGFDNLTDARKVLLG